MGQPAINRKGGVGGILLRLALMCLVGGGALPAADLGRGGPTLENAVKAALLTKLPLFVEWPAEAFDDDSAPIVFGILGEDPFGRQFDEALAKLKVGKRSLVVRRISNVADSVGCHVVYLGAADGVDVAQVLAQLRDKPVLVAGDVSGFAEAGATLGFVKESGKVRFVFNVLAARRAGLVVESTLLSLAKGIVQSDAAPTEGQSPPAREGTGPTVNGAPKGGRT